MNLNDFLAWSPSAPTAAQTSNQLDGATSELEKLLNIGVNAYAAVTQAKTDKQAAQVELAKANATAPVPASAGSSFSPKTLLIAGGVLVAGILVVAFSRK